MNEKEMMKAKGLIQQLKIIAETLGMEMEELIEKASGEESEEIESEESSEGESYGKGPIDRSKVALIVAQMKGKKGE